MFAVTFGPVARALLGGCVECARLRFLRCRSLGGRLTGAVSACVRAREGYAWLSHNTHPDAKVASWWDYGYQTTAMANRTVIVDNNTWNNTHIAQVGRAMSSNEEKAWHILESLDVEYVLVVFGAFIG